MRKSGKYLLFVCDIYLCAKYGFIAKIELDKGKYYHI